MYKKVIKAEEAELKEAENRRGEGGDHPSCLGSSSFGRRPCALPRLLLHLQDFLTTNRI